MLNTILETRADLWTFLCLAALLPWLARRRLPEAARRVREPVWFVVLFLVLVVAGGVASTVIGETPRKRMGQMLQLLVPGYADAMFAMGLMEIGPDTDPQDPGYLRLVELQKKWLDTQTFISDIYVLVQEPDGRILHLVDSETDFDHDGYIDWGRERRTPIGLPYDDRSGEVTRAFAEKGRYSGQVYVDDWGSWVSAWAWHWNERLGMPVLVGIDYDAAGWLRTILRERAMVLVIFLLLLSGLTVAMRLLRLSRADLLVAREMQENLRRERERADDASRAKSRFLAAMSHEIRTPMSAVLGMLDLLRMGRLDPEPREQVNAAWGAARALLDILNEVLDFSRIEAGALRIEPVEMQLGEVVREVARLHTPTATARGLGLDVDLPPDHDRCLRFDAGRVRQVLNNLVSNSIKFTPAGGITLSAHLLPVDAGAAVLRLEVRDTGLGVSPEKQSLIFETFTQVDSPFDSSYGGAGLGLAISKRLVEAMGGRIGLDSVVGVGSVFWLEIPVEPVQAAVTGDGAQDAPAGRPARDAGMPDVAGLPGRVDADVLVVEDNEINQRVALGMLQRLGYTAELALDGEDAITRLGSRTYRLVLMDLHLPGMDGFELTRRWRAVERGAWRLPIVALTADSRPGARDACREAGMDDFLLKPIDLARLEDALRRWIGQPPRD